MKRSGYHIYLAVPTKGSVRWETVVRLNEIRDDTPGLRPIYFQQGSMSVALTRNQIVEAFLKTDCTTLVMVDDDIVPPPHALQLLDSYIPEYGMVSIPHPHPWPGEPSRLILSAYDVNGDGLAPATIMEGMNDVDAVATGCVAISRAAIEATGPLPFSVSNDPSVVIKGEDFRFCADLRLLGFKIGTWADGWFCDHVTTVMLAPLWEGVKING